MNNDYVVIVDVDRYSQWPMVYKSESGADGLVKRLSETLVTFEITEEITSDGGPQFKSDELTQFLKIWGIHHRKPSIEYPQ